MTRFKFWRSVGKSYQEQALIYGYCQCRDDPTVGDEVRRKIKRLLQEVGGEDAAALEVYLCTRTSWQTVTANYPITESTLWRRARKFFANW